MPIYEYQCVYCGYEDSFLESINASNRKSCPKCKRRQAFKRLISKSGFHLKGEGWYVTDFKEKKSPPESKSPKKEDKKVETKTNSEVTSDKKSKNSPSSSEK